MQKPSDAGTRLRATSASVCCSHAKRSAGSALPLINIWASNRCNASLFSAIAEARMLITAECKKRLACTAKRRPAPRHTNRPPISSMASAQAAAFKIIDRNASPSHAADIHGYSEARLLTSVAARAWDAEIQSGDLRRWLSNFACISLTDTVALVPITISTWYAP